MLNSMAFLLIGVILLALGAESLVRGSTRLAAALRIPPLFIGLTVVAYGTSTPELVVSALAAARDLPGVAVGNVVGSNIFNTGVVLGMAAVIRPLKIHETLVRREVPLVAWATILLAVIAFGGRLERYEAALLLAVMMTYTWWTYRQTVQASTVPLDPPASAGTSSSTATNDARNDGPRGPVNWPLGLLFTV
ncbi:MAG TPA: hypothetical protein VLC48_02050, partial [Gemmatimonadota bacterium]|nr:hypothetical protein [Gemmatimonadota bacterium]